MSDGKWIRFDEASLADRKTRRWIVRTTYDDGATVLGEIRFWPRWRKYSFFPKADTLYEVDCLRDLANFCERQTKEWRGGAPRDDAADAHAAYNNDIAHGRDD